MKIALYSSHHYLPGGSMPQCASELFNPRFRSGMVSLVRGTWVWAVLMGLRAIKLPVMGHVSVSRRRSKDSLGRWELSFNVWVQITTLPEEERGQGIPITVDLNGQVMVKPIWVGDNETHTPEKLLENSWLEGAEAIVFRKEFFIKKLEEAKQQAWDESATAKNKAMEAQGKGMLLLKLLS